MTKVKSSKSRANYIHFQRRIYQRYGIELTQSEYKHICNLIQNNLFKDHFVRRESRNRALYKFYIGDQEVSVIYDSNQHNLVTALPTDTTWD